MDGKGQETSLEFYTRPDDPMCNGVMPQVVKTNDVLLKITVPKRTGRKRKRGSLDPYQSDEDDGESKSNSLSRQSNPETLLQSLRDNPRRYKVEPVGMIERSHRYRRKFYPWKYPSSGHMLTIRRYHRFSIFDVK